MKVPHNLNAANGHNREGKDLTPTQKFIIRLSGSFPSFSRDFGWVWAPRHDSTSLPADKPGCWSLPPAPLITSWAGTPHALASCDSPSFRHRVNNPDGSCVSLRDTKEERGRRAGFSCLCVARQLCLEGEPIFPCIKHLYSNETDMQSTDPTLLPICTIDTLRSTTPDGCFARNCANAEHKEGSCPQICQEIALRWKDAGPDNNE